MTKPILVFDVNETLLDITPLEPLFTKWLGDEGAMRRWFAQIVLYSQSLTLAGRYLPFGTIGIGVLEMLARIDDREIPDDAEDQLKSAITNLPPHGDVEPGLRALREAGFRLTTLTNSDAATQETQLSNAGIANFFEARFSVEAVEQFKPATATYRHVAAEAKVDLSQLVMVACHSWDLLGAEAAGCQTVFITRPGNDQPRFGSARTKKITEIADLAHLTW